MGQLIAVSSSLSPLVIVHNTIWPSSHDSTRFCEDSQVRNEGVCEPYVVTLLNWTPIFEW